MAVVIPPVNYYAFLQAMITPVSAFVSVELIRSQLLAVVIAPYRQAIHIVVGFITIVIYFQRASPLF